MTVISKSYFDHQTGSFVLYSTNVGLGCTCLIKNLQSRHVLNSGTITVKLNRTQRRYKFFRITDQVINKSQYARRHQFRLEITKEDSFFWLLPSVSSPAHMYIRT